MKSVNNWDEMQFPLGVTLLGTIIFVVYYTYLSLHGGVPQENSIGIFGNEIWKLESPISYWWEIIISPLVITIIIYYYGSEEDLPRSNRNHTVHDKHSCRDFLRKLITLSLGMTIVLQFAFTVIVPILDNKMVMGPISSSLTWCVIGLAYGYLFIGFIFGFAQILETDEDRNTNDGPRSATERFISFVLRYTQMGVVKTLPMIFGVITGYLLISIYSFIVKIFK